MNYYQWLNDKIDNEYTHQSRDYFNGMLNMAWCADLITEEQWEELHNNLCRHFASNEKVEKPD